MANPDPKPDPEPEYYIDMTGGVHYNAKDCIESNLQTESSNSGGYSAGGNCGQESNDVPDKK